MLTQRAGETQKPKFNAKPLAVVLTALFPVASMATPVVSATGNYDIQYTNWLYGGPESGGFAQGATSSVFQQTAMSNAQSYSDGPEGSLPVSVVSASYDGTNQFATSIVNYGYWNSIPSQTASTAITFSDTITNGGTSAQNTVFDFNIDSLAFIFTPEYVDVNAIHRAGFSANIFLNGNTNSIWSSSFAITAPAPLEPTGSLSEFSGLEATGYDVGLISAVENATCNYGYGNCTFSISGFSDSLNLGLLGAGESLTISYVVSLWTETNAYGGDASVFFNDPSYISGVSHPTASLHLDSPSSTVPEPGSLALASAGLALVGGISGRRKKKQS